MLNGYDEALVLTEDGHISEGSAENIFVIRDGVLLTPPVTDDILEGITRAGIMEICAELGFRVVERTIDRSEIYVADEAFFCGTGAQISPIIEVDRRAGRQRGRRTDHEADQGPLLRHRARQRPRLRPLGDAGLRPLSGPRAVVRESTGGSRTGVPVPWTTTTSARIFGSTAVTAVTPKIASRRAIVCGYFVSAPL